MTGSTPRAGKKPSSEGSPWSATDREAAWWRGDDTGPDEPQPAPAEPVQQPAPAEPDEPQPASSGPDEHQPATTGPGDQQPDRYDEPTGDVLGGRPAGAADVPEVMVLPEPPGETDRPTEAVPRGPVPGQSPPGRGRAGRGQPAPRSESKLETSTFWLAGDETDESRTSRPTPPAGSSRLGVPPRPRRNRPPRRPGSGLLGLLALSLVATFFAWVSAEPFWLAVGHGDRGTAVVTRCTGEGVGQRCVGRFTAARGDFTAPRVALLGIAQAQRDPGSALPARMVHRQGRQAYVGSATVLLHLRWAIGVLLVLLCGMGIAVLTGARRLASARARRGATLLSLAGPLVLLAGFLALAY